MRLARSILLLSRRKHSYITTPIFYANAAPHLGHLYTVVLADAAHRWQKLKDPDGTHIFSTGTDEHGIKIFRAAEQAGKNPVRFCDGVSKKFHDLFQDFGIANTDFIRTTEDHHKLCVEHVWKRLYDEGFIYKDVYSGWYSVVDECFFMDGDVEDTSSGKVVKGTKNTVEWVEEQNYMFRLSSFKEKVRHWLLNSDVVRPKHYLQFVLQYLELDGDLSISRSRTRLPWGIQVPGDDTQTIYVWLDALVNYLSVTGYPETMKVWPPTWQILGKDIMKFHAFYWPAFLMAMELPLPQKLFIHGHWLVDNAKMSKSVGNVIDPYEAMKTYSTEGLRYFLLKQGLPQGDSNFSREKAINVINSDLVNSIGNLLSRATVKKLNPSQEYRNFTQEALDGDLAQMANSLLEELEQVREKTLQLYDDMLFYKAIEGILAVVKSGNGFFQFAQPWKLDQGEKLDSVLYLTYEVVRITSVLLQPIIPSLADQALNRLGIPLDGRRIDAAVFCPTRGSIPLGANLGPLLPRINEKLRDLDRISSS
ncbi:methionine--tRNA ligase [Ancylostoma caninum]|uniref:Methionine--tRNA ligase, mitochondrial n=1 Tax=Ancylostoma caninum TaxID=29170 RepID=A0A368FMH4_ANCCA|nr:methionine--tRNA ligase [Ancylostoma caninum]